MGLARLYAAQMPLLMLVTLQVVPWFVRLWLHTLELTINGQVMPTHYKCESTDGLVLSVDPMCLKPYYSLAPISLSFCPLLFPTLDASPHPWIVT